MFNQGVHSYRKVNVTTSNSVQLIVMCYEGAINNLKIAKQKYKENDFEAKGKAIRKFMEIIAELQCALDFEKGAEVAKNLDAVYNFMTHTIVKADMNKDFAAIDTVINMLSELMSAWETLQKRQHEFPQTVPGQYGQFNPLKKQGHIAA